MLYCFLSGVCAGLLVGMTAGEPEACTMPISETAGQAPGDGSKRSGMPEIIGMVWARERLFQMNCATGGEDSELQTKPPKLKPIKLLWLITFRGASAGRLLIGSTPVILWEWG